MAEQQIPQHPRAMDRQVVDCGGLRFESTFRAPAGATLRVFGEVDGDTDELLRFDDFIEGPHYHVPAAADPIPFDQERLGEPLAWFVSQLRDHLAELLDEAGFARLVPEVDFDAITEHAEDVREAMEACVPEGYVRLPGVGLRRAPA
jgi:hypothetical protein